MATRVFFLCLAGLLVHGECARPNGTAREVFAPRGVKWADFLPCVVALDVSCAFDEAEGVLQDVTHGLMVEADSQALPSTGRADEENSPSVLVQSISKAVSEFLEVFKNSISGFFRNAKENEDDENENEEEEGDKEQASRRSEIESRGKKKKKKLVGLIKLLILGAVIKAKLTLLLKLLAVKLQIKFFLVALAGLLLNAARFYLDLKKGHQPQKVIYYEHAQHQHHYEGGDEEWAGPSSGGGYWGRSYDDSGDGKKAAHAQDLAYNKQKPYAFSVVDNKPNFSWN